MQGAIADSARVSKFKATQSNCYKPHVRKPSAYLVGRHLCRQ